MGAQGPGTLDFGAFPGASHATVDVVATGVVSTSLVEAWLRPAVTADHSADEHMVETLKVFGTYLSDNNIRIHGFNTNQINEPLEDRRNNPFRFSGTQQADPAPSSGGQGTFIYGQWAIAWVWN